MNSKRFAAHAALASASWCALTLLAPAQLTDVTQAPNAVNAGIQKSLTEQIGAGRGDVFTPGSSRFLIARDPFRAIRRGRQLFQRKFTEAQGLGPRTQDGIGDITADRSLGAGLSDSCASCHGRPFGSAGFGGNVSTRPLSRDAQHLFGLGLKEMLADEITQELRDQRDQASLLAQQTGTSVKIFLSSKGLGYGSIRALPDGSFDVSGVDGVDADLRVRPFFHHGGTVSMREFIVGALNAEMGLESPDPDLVAAAVLQQDVMTPAGMLLSGASDLLEAPPVSSASEDPDLDGVTNEIDPAAVDFMEFYLLNYFKPALGLETPQTQRGRLNFEAVGCAECHVPDLLIEKDRRVADVETVWNGPQSNGVFNELFATAATLYDSVDDGSGFPTLKVPKLQPFLVRNIFSDFKRHDLGPGFDEVEYDGTVTREHITSPLWGAGTTAPYGHDGRSTDLRAVILRHGGEALASRQAFLDLSFFDQLQVIAFLQSLILFSPEDTASNLNPADLSDPTFPATGHGSIPLVPLFNDPADPE